MTERDPAPPADGDGRVVARHDAGRPGPTLVVTGGLHGNEPAGLEAGRRVVGRLAARGIALRGRLAVVAGNRPALAAGRRYLDRDLNRHWHDRSLEALGRRDATELCREDREQLALAACLAALVEEAGGDAVGLDLHSTSGAAPPFSVIIDGAGNRALARALEIPAVLGFEQHVDAPILSWWHARGLRAVGVEGGAHGDPETVEHLEAVVWLTLAALGSVDEDALPRTLRPRYLLRADARGVPPLVRIVHRHGVVPGAGFRMEPGFQSFEPVVEGQLLAMERTGPVRAPASGLLFLPRYQDQGSDGFFIVVPAR